MFEKKKLVETGDKVRKTKKQKNHAWNNTVINDENISKYIILQFYEYIGYIKNISMNILIQNIDDIKINKNSKNIKNYIISKNKYFKVIF